MRRDAMLRVLADEADTAPPDEQTVAVVAEVRRR